MTNLDNQNETKEDMSIFLNNEAKEKIESDFASFKIMKMTNVAGGSKMLIIGKPPQYMKDSIVKIAAQNDIIVEFIDMTLT